MTVRVTVWNEYRQEHTDPPVRAIYPDGIHGAIGEASMFMVFASESLDHS